MLVLVQGIPQIPGSDGVWRAGRKWPAGSPLTVEVLGSDEDPPPVKLRGTDGVERLGPDPTRIGRKSFEMLKADPRIRILADGESQAQVANDAFDAVKAQAARLAARVAELEADKEQLVAAGKAAEEELSDSREELAGLQAHVVELQAELNRLRATPAPEAPTPPPEDPPARQDKKEAAPGKRR